MGAQNRTTGEHESRWGREGPDPQVPEVQLCSMADVPNGQTDGRSVESGWVRTA